MTAIVTLSRYIGVTTRERTASSDPRRRFGLGDRRSAGQLDMAPKERSGRGAWAGPRPDSTGRACIENARPG